MGVCASFFSSQEDVDYGDKNKSKNKSKSQNKSKKNSSGGAGAGDGGNNDDENTQENLLKTQPTANHNVVEEDENAEILNSEEYRDYKASMQQVFYLFAGYQQYGKTNLEMRKQELQRFLDIVCITEDVNSVFSRIDSAVVDNKITLNEWMEYFCVPSINPNALELMDHIQSQITWKLLQKALGIFQILDNDHSGKLEYGEFREFGNLIDISAEETEQLWLMIDTDGSGDITLNELFEWFRLRLYMEMGRMRANNSIKISISNDHDGNNNNNDGTTDESSPDNNMNNRDNAGNNSDNSGAYQD